ncbi:MAG: nuclear transport factor 2 family protein [Pseudonocardiaceae bacterium]
MIHTSTRQINLPRRPSQLTSHISDYPHNADVRAFCWRRTGLQRSRRLDDSGSMSPDGPADRQGQLTDLYAAFNRRDMPALLAAMAPDVVWPNGWEGGTLRGRDEVCDYWTRQWGQIVPTVSPTGFRPESDGRIAVAVHQVVRDKAGTIIADGTVTHVYRFVDGLVTEMEILE